MCGHMPNAEGPSNVIAPIVPETDTFHQFQMDVHFDAQITYIVY